MTKTKKIWFEQSDTKNPVPLQFEPASLHLPTWYKKMDPYKNEKPMLVDGDIVNATAKRCAPVYDALSFGYVAVLHCDLQIDINQVGDDEYDLSFQYASKPAPISCREYNPKYSLELDDSYLPVELTWLTRWSICTEPNSSVLITHPLNRLDLPFTTSSGVMDTDSGFLVETGAAPFYLKKGFNGFIPCGTPMFQVIPFERQKYKHEVRELSELNKSKRLHKWQKHFANGYRKEYRSGKKFE